MLPVGRLEDILGQIVRLGTPDEVTIEMNPESLSAAHERLVDVGLTRISMGIQSLQERHLRTLGRNARREDNVSALRLMKDLRARTRWQLNCDLMTCIPGQTVTDALGDIDELIALAEPDHISLYNLTVEEGTVLAEAVGTRAQ